MSTWLVAGLLSATGTIGWAAPARSVETSQTRAAYARVCPEPPAGSAVIPDVPWPQQRYDLGALSQISDGAGVIVAVVDSGVSAAHPQLARAVRTGYDLLDSGGDGTEDCAGHGTAVASIIAARPDPGAGLRGLAPAVGILPVRVSDRVDETVAADGGVSELAAGIRAAVRSRPKPAVINLSISTTRNSATLRAAVRAALDADIVVVAAAGNRHASGNPAPYPAGYPGVVGVGAIGPDGLRVASSQTGAHVDLVAPGDGVVAAAPSRGHQAYQGTSFAAAFVTATAALIRARWPQLGQAEVVQRLLATADPAAGAQRSPEYGYGVLNPMRALTEVVLPAPALATSAPVPVIGVGVRAEPARRGPSAIAAGTAAVLIICAAALALIAAAVPQGRRRHWRPGRVEPSPAVRPSPSPSRTRMVR
jgi:type VII secretion-associated serine protease mycosin